MRNDKKDAAWRSGLLEPLLVLPSGVKARGMTSVKMGREQKEGLTRIAMSIFIDMVNSGESLHSCVTAVYLSGLQHGAESQKVINLKEQ